MKTKSWIGWAAFGALVIGPGFARAAPRPSIGALESSGEGCPAGTAFPTLGPDLEGQWTYQIVFSRLRAATGPTTPSVAIDCRLSVNVIPPPGYSMRIARMLVQGAHVTHGGASTRLEGSYSLVSPGVQPLPPFPLRVEPARKAEGWPSMSVENIPSTEGNWGVTVNDAPSVVSRCNEEGNLTVDLGATLALQADRGGADRDAEIDLQRNDVGMAWGWRFDSCGFSGGWRSTYDSGGNTVGATLDVRGDRGTYRTSSFTGQLFDIERRYSGGPLGFDDPSRRLGPVEHVHGRWSALGSDGWFDFDLNGETFDGHWGLGSAGPTAGRWRGRRE